jgi:hypothetical protein
LLEVLENVTQRIFQCSGFADVEPVVIDAAQLIGQPCNAQRKLVTDAEEAEAFILLRDEGYVLREVAAQARRSEAYVSKRIRVFEDSRLRTAVERDQLAVSMAEEFLTVAPGDRATLVARHRRALRHGARFAAPYAARRFATRSPLRFDREPVGRPENQKYATA